MPVDQVQADGSRHEAVVAWQDETFVAVKVRSNRPTMAVSPPSPPSPAVTSPSGSTFAKRSLLAPNTPSRVTYRYRPETDPRCFGGEGAVRVHRGGARCDATADCHSASRSSAPRLRAIGFRIVMESE